MKKTKEEEAAEVLRVLNPKDVSDMTVEEFRELPLRGWDEDIGEFRSLVILPTETIHDSGFRCMEFVAIGAGGKPICRLSGCSDVVHLGGIGSTVPFGPKRLANWSIDCLKESGLLRAFCDCPIVAGLDLSSFEVIPVERKEKAVDK